MEPEADPPDAGPKVTLNVVLPPAAIVAGNARPLRLKPVPAILACVIVRLDEPVFDSCIVWELGDPTVTFPKFADDGVAEIPGWIPVPLNVTIDGEFGAELTTEMLPLVAPTVEGENFAVNETF
jgi:hypothetical protein